MEAASRVIERERERIKKRLAPHYRNTVWEKERQNDLTLQVEYVRILVMSLIVLINGHLLENSSLLNSHPSPEYRCLFLELAHTLSNSDVADRMGCNEDQAGTNSVPADPDPHHLKKISNKLNFVI